MPLWQNLNIMISFNVPNFPYPHLKVIYSDYLESDRDITFITYSNDAPITGETFEFDGLKFKVLTVIDCTSVEEADEGLSYSEIYCIETL